MLTSALPSCRVPERWHRSAGARPELPPPPGDPASASPSASPPCPVLPLLPISGLRPFPPPGEPHAGVSTGSARVLLRPARREDASRSPSLACGGASLGSDHPVNTSCPSSARCLRLRPLGLLVREHLRTPEDGLWAVFIPVEYSLDDGSFAVCFGMVTCRSFNFVLLYQDHCGYSGSLAILCDF